MTVTSCGGKRYIFYSCTTLSMTDFHELLPFSQLSDLTTATICNAVRQHLDPDRFTQHKTLIALQITNMVAQMNTSRLIRVTSIFPTSNCYILAI